MQTTRSIIISIMMNVFVSNANRKLEKGGWVAQKMNPYFVYQYINRSLGGHFEMALYA